ncbi:MAG TPA: IPT/TIG domain-containing protein [Geobacteraceae bacterium]|nr:IPT/TIG domain-containing protein [Geobacteraceae bacterium]
MHRRMMFWSGMAFILFLFGGCGGNGDPFFPTSLSPIISGFSPTSGPVGTSVTISGTNFSTTPASNTVKFNGTAATVTSSTASQIITTVPAGATTGPISVTVAGNTATSSTSFTVTSAVLTAVGYDGDPVPANGRGEGDATTESDEYLVFFDTTTLAPYVGQRVVGLRIAYCSYSGNPATWPFVAVLYNDSGTPNTPGTQLFSDSVTFSKGWNDVTLINPVTITSSTELWAGFQVNLTGWPVSYDNNAVVPNTQFVRYSPFTGAAFSIGAPHNLNVRLLVSP